LNGFERVEEFKPVSAYDFVRLKFILTARDYPVQPLRPLGERLLKRDPKDYFVKLALTPILWEDDPVQGPLKRRYIAEMMQYAPKDSRPRQMLARMAFNKWYFAKDRKGPEAAIAEIRRLENLEPKLPQFQRYAEYQIQLMQRIQSRRQAAASQTKEAAH
jgi:hypothetical protein